MVEHLAEARIGRAGDGREVAFEAQRERERVLVFAGLDLHVDGRGEAEVQHLADDVRLLEVERRSGEVVAHPAANAVHHGQDVAVLRLQTDRHFGVRFGRVLGVHEAQVVEDGHPDVVVDDFDLVVADRPPHVLLDGIDDALGLLDARPGRRAKVEPEEAGVDGGEEVEPDEADEGRARDDEDRAEREDQPPVRHRGPEQRAVGAGHAIEGVAARPVEAREEAGVGALLLFLEPLVLRLLLRQEHRRERRHQRPREEVRREHREDDRQRERRRTGTSPAR